MKECFVPKLDAFVFADYSNIEAKLLGLYLETLGFPSMAEVFRAGVDLHAVTAAGVVGKPLDQVDKKERQIGKRLNYSIIYGGGVPTIVDQLGITPKEALDLVKQYHTTWPGIGWATKSRPAPKGTLNWAIAERVASRGYITTLYGRHLHPRKPHAAINNLVQGCAADLMKWAMARAHEGLLEGGFRSHIVNMVHDELMLDCPMDELPQINELLPEWMTDPRIEAVVPIRPECELSYQTWAEKAPFEEVYR